MKKHTAGISACIVWPIRITFRADAARADASTRQGRSVADVHPVRQHILIRGALVAMACLCWCSHALSLDGRQSIVELRHTGWGAKEGAPSGIATIAQTTDGYLWVGTATGLFRFDGLHFERMELPSKPGLSSVNVYSLYAPATGGLWIGFAFGEAAFLKDGVVTWYLPLRKAGTVVAFAQDDDGTIWANTTKGVAQFNAGRLELLGPNWNAPTTRGFSLMVDSQGTLWAGSVEHLHFLPKGQRSFHEYKIELVGGVTAAESPSGEVWVADDKGIRQVQKNVNPTKRTTQYGRSVVFDHDGGLWTNHQTEGPDAVRRIAYPAKESAISTVRFEDLHDAFSSAQGLVAGANNDTVLVDRDGDVWVSGVEGLDRFSNRSIIPLLSLPSRPKDLTAVTADVAAADGGGIWITQTLSHWGYLVEDRTFVRHDEIVGANCVARGLNGAVWFGTNKNLLRFASGRFDSTPLPPGPIADAQVQAIAEDATGAVWASIMHLGVYRLANGQWTKSGGLADLDFGPAVTMSTDRVGRVWLGYPEGRVALIDRGKLRVFTPANGIDVGNVTAVYGQRKNVWIGGELGLAVLEGDRFRTVTPLVPSTFRSVTGIVETSDGDLWLNAAPGIVHVTVRQIEAYLADPAYRVPAEVFDLHDGFEGTGSRIRPLPTMIEATDGNLWLTSSVGIYSLDPRQIFRSQVRPSVLIQSLTSNGKVYLSSDRLDLPKRTTELRFAYTEPDLTSADKIRYRYKLDGVDKDWVDAQTRREASYTNLGPGTYKFHVAATNWDGTWSDSDTSASLTIAPTFFQTSWFIALCLAGFAAAIWALIRLRVRQLGGRMRALLEERNAERERIARELHDTLLQGAQGLVLSVHAAAAAMPDSNPARGMLDRSIARANLVIAEGRDRIQDLRTPSEADLADALSRVGAEVTQGGPVKFGVVVEGSSRRLSPTIQQEAYAIGREAILNAYRHADAASIEVQIIFGDDALRIRVRDDGTGMAPGAFEEEGRPGHWGLKGMRERAKKIDAKIDVWTRPGAGTEIEVSVPVATAYESLPSRSRWRSFLGLVGEG